MGAVLYLVAVRAARKHLWSSRILLLLSVLSGVALMVIVLSDWPGEQLAKFWADHSIFAAVVSTLLLVSVGYLAFEADETAEQEKLDRSATSAGLSGLVDHLVDIDIALSLMQAQDPPAVFDPTGRPLRWIRPIRESLQGGGSAAVTAPRETLNDAQWRRQMLDHCIRRIIAAMRDWAALVGISQDGRLALKRFGEIRLALVELSGILNEADAAASELDRLRLHLQLMAVGIEHVSSPGRPRPGLTNFLPGPRTADKTGALVDALRNVQPNTRAILRFVDKRAPIDL